MIKKLEMITLGTTGQPIMIAVKSLNILAGKSPIVMPLDHSMIWCC